MLQPATKTRFEIGLNVKGKSSQGILEEVKTANAMCSHKINVTSENEISPEVIDWLKISYQDAG
jgi:hypothetical protein